jgi:3',5'-cyclic AMP phosphodiesterase CpdA
VKILHLSDLHFGSTFDPSLWEYVGKVLAGSDKPNVVVVTGDLVDSPSFFMLALARNELQALTKRWCGGGNDCELLVIPGNHDIGILGNYAGWPWRSKFAIVFSQDHAALFDRLPTYSEYSRQALWWSCAHRRGHLSRSPRIARCASHRLIRTANRGWPLGTFPAPRPAKSTANYCNGAYRMTRERF